MGNCSLYYDSGYARFYQVILFSTFLSIIKLSRTKLGPDFIFVLLEMDLDTTKERLRKRHHGDEQAVEMLAVTFSFDQIQLILIIQIMFFYFDCIGSQLSLHLMVQTF